MGILAVGVCLPWVPQFIAEVSVPVIVALQADSELLGLDGHIGRFLRSVKVAATNRDVLVACAPLLPSVVGCCAGAALLRKGRIMCYFWRSTLQ